MKSFVLKKYYVNGSESGPVVGFSPTFTDLTIARGEADISLQKELCSKVELFELVDVADLETIPETKKIRWSKP